MDRTRLQLLHARFHNHGPSQRRFADPGSVGLLTPKRSLHLVSHKFSPRFLSRPRFAYTDSVLFLPPKQRSHSQPVLERHLLGRKRLDGHLKTDSSLYLR